MSKKTTPSTPTSPKSSSKRPAAPDLFGTTIKPAEKDEMTMYGIKRVSVDYFHFGDFRYTNLADAIAQAKRGCDSLSSVRAPDSKQT